METTTAPPHAIPVGLTYTCPILGVTYKVEAHDGHIPFEGALVPAYRVSSSDNNGFDVKEHGVLTVRWAETATDWGLS